MIKIHTLHIKGPWVNSSWFCTGVASIVSGIVVTGCGGIYLGKYIQLTQFSLQLTTKTYNTTIQLCWH